MRGTFSLKITAFVLAFLFTAMSFLPSARVDAASQATRDQMEYWRRHQQTANQAVTEQQNLLEGTYAEMHGVMAQIQALDQQMQDALMTLEVIEHALWDTETRIAYTETALYEAQIEWELQNEVLRMRLRAMYEAGPVGYVAILLQAENFADFFMRLEYVTVIYNADRRALARMEEAWIHLENTSTQLSREEILLRDLETYESEAIAELERLMEERGAWFAELANDAEQLEALIAILEEEARAIDAEFGLVQAQYRAELAEAERIRLERQRQERLEQQRQAEAARAAEVAANPTAAAAAATSSSFDGQFAWPLPARGPGDISSPFGPRTNPVTGRSENHSGIDIPAPAGTRIVAAADGVVRLAGWSGGFGITVIIDHGNGYSTLYAHNSRNRVVEGQRVSRGDHIADVGTTGQSTGNHLHFEIRRNGTPVNPMNYF